MSDAASIDLLVFQLWSSGWVDWTGSLQSIRIERGGAVTVDVGTITAVLVRTDDPVADAAIVTGQPIRVIRKGTTTPLFTGVVEDAESGIVRIGDGEVRNGITVIGVDAVAAHSKTTRYGAVTDGGAGHETWVSRITRLALSSDTTVSLPTEPVTPYTWECQDVAYVSSLASHFDLACQSIGANWYVDAGNVTRFRAPDASSISAGTFSDRITDQNQYDDVTITAGTKRVVNELKVTNHGRGDDGNTYDIATTFIDEDSIAAYGVRAASMDTSVWDADTVLSGRAQAVFDAYADPVREVDEIVWDGQQNPALAASLDIQTSVTILADAETFHTRIVALSHDIGPSWWTITAKTSTRGVPEAQASGSAYASTPATGAAPIDRDARAPQAPTGLSVDPFAAWQGGQVVLAIDASWTAVTLGDNGAPINVSLYEVWGRPDDGVTPPKRIGTTTGLEVAATDPAFVIGDVWLVKVFAASEAGVPSPFSTEVSVTLTEPAEVLQPPTQLTVWSAAGNIYARWDGKLASTPVAAAPPQLARVNIKMSTSSGSGYTTIGVAFVAGDSIAIGAADIIGATRFLAATAVDRLGRETALGAYASVTVVGVLVNVAGTPTPLDTALADAQADADLALTNAAAAQTTANAAPTITTASSAPGSPKAGDVWLNSSYSPARAATYSGSAWVYDAVTVAAAGTMPTQAIVGDTYINTSTSPYTQYLCVVAYTSGGVLATNWRQTDAVAAAAATAALTTVTVGASIPSTAKVGDVYKDTSSPAKVYVCTTAYTSGGVLATNWTQVDASSAAAASAAQTTATAAPKITTASTAPSSPKSGDVWINSAYSPARTAVYSGTAWLYDTQAFGPTGTLPTQAVVGDLYLDGSTPPIAYLCKTAYTSGGVLATQWVRQDLTAANAAAAAQTTANARNTTFRQSSAPTAIAIGDLWIDSDDNRLYRATATGTGSWVLVQDSDIASALSQAGAAQTTANGRNRIYTSTTTPAPSPAAVAGDLWYQTNGSGQVISVQTYSGSAWVARAIVADSVLVPGSAGTVSIADSAITTPKLSVTDEMMVALATAHKIVADDVVIGSLMTALIEAGLRESLDLISDTAINLVVGQLAETRNTFRVTTDGAEIRSALVTAYMKLTATALQLIGPNGTVGAQITAAGLEAPTVITDRLQFDHFTAVESADGNRLTWT